jgi:hypothetical protein
VGSLIMCLRPDDLLASRCINRFPRCDMLTAVLLSMETWGEGDSAQASVLRARSTRCFCQRLAASMGVTEEHATFIELLRMGVFG